MGFSLMAYAGRLTVRQDFSHQFLEIGCEGVHAQTDHDLHDAAGDHHAVRAGSTQRRHINKPGSRTSERSRVVHGSMSMMLATPPRAARMLAV
jgi:hypothetical protein